MNMFARTSERGDPTGASYSYLYRFSLNIKQVYFTQSLIGLMKYPRDLVFNLDNFYCFLCWCVS